jgi:hypothetical protein
VTYTAPFTVSQSSTVKFRSTDVAGNAEATNTQAITIDATAPTTTISCNGGSCAGNFSAAVTVALSATDGGGSGVGATLYTIDGTDPATSGTAQTYTAPFTVAQSTTVKFRSADVIGNVESTKSQAISVITGPPVTKITCNGATCATWYNATVTVTLTATDPQGPGVASTHYTTNGTDPTLSSPTYTAPFALTSTKTVKFRSWDTAGTVESVNTQLVQIDTGKPTTSFLCGGTTCSTGWYVSPPVSVTLGAADAASGIDKIYYTTDGTTPTTSSTVYSAPFNVQQTTTVQFIATDKAGNTSPVASKIIKIDAAPPTVSITKPVAGATVRAGSVTVTAKATDLGTGTGAASGIQQVQFFRDAGVSLGTDTSGNYSLTWTATVGTHTLYAVATDKAGNTTTSSVITVRVN